MTEEQAYLIFCLEPIICVVLSIFFIFVWDKLRQSDRESSKRYPRPGTEPFRPESKLKKWNRSNDMLENGKHPSRQNKD